MQQLPRDRVFTLYKTGTKNTEKKVCDILLSATYDIILSASMWCHNSSNNVISYYLHQYVIWSCQQQCNISISSSVYDISVSALVCDISISALVCDITLWALVCNITQSALVCDITLSATIFDIINICDIILFQYMKCDNMTSDNRPYVMSYYHRQSVQTQTTSLPAATDR